MKHVAIQCMVLIHSVAHGDWQDASDGLVPDGILDHSWWPCLLSQLMHLHPVTLLGIYLYGLCSVAYAGKPICIFVTQQVLGVLLLHILLQGRICACKCPGLIVLVARYIHPASTGHSTLHAPEPTITSTLKVLQNTLGMQLHHESPQGKVSLWLSSNPIESSVVYSCTASVTGRCVSCHMAR